MIQEPTTSASVDSSPTSACNEAKIYPKSPEMQNENMRPMKTLLQQQIKQLETSRKQHEYEIEVAQGYEFIAYFRIK